MNKKYNYYILLTLFFSCIESSVSYAQQPVLNEYSCYLVSFRQQAQFANKDDPSKIQQVIQTSRVLRVPCGDRVFLAAFRQTGGVINPIPPGQASGIVGFMIKPKEELSACISTGKHDGYPYFSSCSEGTKKLDTVIDNKSYNYTLTVTGFDARLDQQCKFTSDNIFVNTSCGNVSAFAMYAPSSDASTCNYVGLTKKDNMQVIETRNLSCPTTPGYDVQCQAYNSEIDCTQTGSILMNRPSTEFKITSAKYKSPHSILCDDKDDPKCKMGEKDRKVSYAEEGDMLIYPRTYRPLPYSSATTDPADAILAQTSYLARVMMQANDVFPPSHISSRSSGEIYASSVIPLEYNSKLLSSVSSYRNSLGATQVSSDNFPVSKNDVVRDWVEFHIDNYCDPLAESNGLKKCGAALQARNKKLAGNKSLSRQSREEGITPWEGVMTEGKPAPFAADITAYSLFSKDLHSGTAEAALRYIYNLTNAVPNTFSGSGSDKDPKYNIPSKYITQYKDQTVLKDEGYDVYMSYLEQQSKLSLYQYAMIKIFSDRLKLDNIKIPKEVWKEGGTKEIEYKPTSRFGLLEFEATKRFKDPGWYDRLSQMPTPALLKEIAYMESTRLALDIKKYEQQQIQTAIFASLASDFAKMLQQMKSSKQDAEQAGKDAIDNMMNKFKNL